MSVRPLVAALVLTVPLFLTGCLTTEEDKKQLQGGFASYSARNYEAAEGTANAFILKNPDSDNVDEALYLRGVSRLSRGGAANRAMAAQDLKQAIAKSKRPDLKAKAFRVLGDLYFDDQRFAESESNYEQALAIPGAAGATLAHLNYRVGACLQAQGEWDKAKPYLQNVASDRSDPILADRAAARVNMTSYTLQFGAFTEGPRAGLKAAELKKAGIATTIVSELQNGKFLFIVRSGTYRTWAEADAARDAYQAKGMLVTVVP